jgi:hypothetical protein
MHTIQIYFYDWQEIDGEGTRMMIVDIESFKDIDSFLEKWGLTLDDVNTVNIFKEGTEFLERD